MRQPLSGFLDVVSTWPVHYMHADPLPELRRDFEGASFLLATIDLRSVVDIGSLIDALIACIGLPGYTGHNFNALDDSLADVPEPHDGYVLVAHGAADFWSRIPDLGLGFVGSWVSGAAFWAKSNTPFHLVFVA